MSSREPVKNTCPKIDSILSRITVAQSECYYIKDNTKNSPDFSDYVDEFVTIHSELEYAKSDIEDVREANYKLRNWGKEQAEEVDNLEDSIDELKSEKDDLEATIHNLNETISQLTNDL